MDFCSMLELMLAHQITNEFKIRIHIGTGVLFFIRIHIDVNARLAAIMELE